MVVGFEEISAIVSAILEQMTAITINKVIEAGSLVQGAEKELEDAEEKDYVDERVKLWLDKFKDVSYDMEDVLDGWETAVQQLQTDPSGCASVRKWKVCPFVSCFSSGSQVSRRYNIATKIKEINEEVDEIVEDKLKFELIQREIKQLKRPETTTFVVVSELIGRDAMKEEIISILLCEDKCRNVPTITLVGMGGIGKTALAQLIYKDHRIQTHFSKTIWVYWEPLKAAFKYGMPGSSILVSTDKESVARRMESLHVFRLKLLSEEMCWLILSQKAFTGRSQASREILEDIGRKIANKCQGLPLAAKTSGVLLQDKQGREDYYDLPSPIRQCLSYCAIFPNSNTIYKDELIQCWMAQGYLNSDDDRRRELIGEDYMHDMVHEFVQFLTEHRFVTEEVPRNSTLDMSSKRVRHLRLVIQSWDSSPLSICRIEKLRSLVVVSDDETSGDALQDLLSRSKLLRFLEFDSLHLRPEQIAGGMKNLIHLRYLSLISFCELINLQSLNLRGCLDLKKLAVGMGKLINLRYLCINECPCLSYYPKGIHLLSGNLCVELIGDALNWDEANRAKLHKKIHLKRTDIWICSPNIKKEEVFKALNPPSTLLVELFDYKEWLDFDCARFMRIKCRTTLLFLHTHSCSQITFSSSNRKSTSD
ncbi:hypothetical protein E1A91_A11G269700v1 [Gossypium mustelinum]|uniref:NB-ARC domain-containing protein n=1 Tax=Gossypium mustelinum TaxID=34275 RepID=A0A5D2XB83_GOSMU|nr:hypothetical protein E1A91_A11G269700v1 [Gossypium mustelinum]